jgi:hypothetical protein
MYRVVIKICTSNSLMDTTFNLNHNIIVEWFSSINDHEIPGNHNNDLVIKSQYFLSEGINRLWSIPFLSIKGFEITYLNVHKNETTFRIWTHTHYIKVSLWVQRFTWSVKEYICVRSITFYRSMDFEITNVLGLVFNIIRRCQSWTLSVIVYNEGYWFMKSH